jgi:hypothetical protein
MTSPYDSVLIDGIKSIAVNNGVVRLQTFRLGAAQIAGQQSVVDSVELCIPVTAIKDIIAALTKIK